MAAFLTDSFTEASSTLLQSHAPEVGGSWALHSSFNLGAPTVGAGTGVLTANPANYVSIAACTATPASPDYIVTAVAKNASAGRVVGVAARLQSYTSGLTCIAGYIGNNVAAISRYGGAGTGVLASVAYTTVLDTYYTIALEVSGTSVTLKVNGAVVATATETSITGAGYAATFCDGVATYDSINASYPAAAATAITLEGPTAGVTGSPSSNFTVGADGAITGTVVVTPASSPAEGTFSPTTVSISEASPTGTFTYSAASDGTKTISVTNNGGLSNPTSISYTATTSVVPTVTDIADKRVFQRIAGASSITISGTYVGTATGIQARIVQAGTSTEVVTWTTIAASPSGGVFSGSLSVPQGGWYNVQVRDTSNPTAVSSGTHQFGVGDIFVVAGQSNGEKMFTVGAVTPASTTAKYSGTWGANVGAGACTLANALTSALGIPIGMISTAVSGAGLCTSTASPYGSWDNPATAPYTTWANLVTGVGGKIAGVLWLQGEWDAGTNVAKATYKSALSDLITRMRTYTSQPTLPFYILPLTRYTVATYVGWDNVQDAFIESFSSDVIKACDTWEVSSDDGLHYNEAGQIVIANRTALAIRKFYGQSVESLGPYLVSASLSGSIVDAVFAHVSGSDLSPASGITGLTFVSNGTPVVPVSVAKVNATTVRATFSNPLDAPVYVAVAVGTNPNATAPLVDSVGLPAQRTLTGGILSFSKVVSFVLTSDGSTPAASLTGLKWAFFDSADLANVSAPSAAGSGATTDASGNFVINVPASTLDSGGVGWLVVSDSDGTLTQNPAHKAYSGPVTVTVQ